MESERPFVERLAAPYEEPAPCVGPDLLVYTPEEFERMKGARSSAGPWRRAGCCMRPDTGEAGARWVEQARRDLDDARFAREAVDTAFGSQG
ncbi:MAG: hypothetical protein KatS3mg014_1102 [Actinomycetota bacterium]|nr:MAG: hypothetical protein KatS3mg014_1102 [Actinomycetota bacterium]